MTYGLSPCPGAPKLNEAIIPRRDRSLSATDFGRLAHAMLGIWRLLQQVHCTCCSFLYLLVKPC